MAQHAGSPVTGYKSKTVATWLALLLGSLGVHRFYLHGPADKFGWLYPLPTLAGLVGVQHLRTFGQDDPLAWLLIPVLGLAITAAMFSAILYGLTPDATWDARHNPGQPVRRTTWGPVIGAVLALAVGGTVLMGTVAYGGQKFFEWQLAPPS
jgi:TM2 domain-containing membrane protein YozV